MSVRITFWQLVQPHTCDLMADIRTEKFWRITKNYAGGVAEYYVRDSWYQKYYCGPDLPATPSNDEQRVDFDIASCCHHYHGWTDDYDPHKRQNIYTMTYGEFNSTHIYTSSTFELGKCYDVKKVGQTYMFYDDYPSSLTDAFPTSNNNGLYTGPILKHIVEQLHASRYETLRPNITLDTTTMFARYNAY